jgi:hypothetical protein
MNQLIRARVALPCILRSPASMEEKAGGVTEELTRDTLLLRLPRGPAAHSLRTVLALVVDIELPAADRRSARYLECTATVRSALPAGDTVQILLDVTSMNFIAPKTATGKSFL